MKFRPILFSGEMVQAILAGRKTQTRRIMKPQAKCTVPKDCATCNEWRLDGKTSNACPSTCVTTPEPPCSEGDILWVRETWAHPSEAEVRNGADPDMFIYKADSPLLPAAHGRWHPSIHMPKDAARIFLRVKDVRAERLWDISEADCLAEGIMGFTKDGKITKFSTQSGDMPSVPWQDMPENPVHAFWDLWNSTIKSADRNRYGWLENPWVWVVEFERCDKPEGWCSE